MINMDRQLAKEALYHAGLDASASIEAQATTLLKQRGAALLCRRCKETCFEDQAFAELWGRLGPLCAEVAQLLDCDVSAILPSLMQLANEETQAA